MRERPGDFRESYCPHRKRMVKDLEGNRDNFIYMHLRRMEKMKTSTKQSQVKTTQSSETMPCEMF